MVIPLKTATLALLAMLLLAGCTQAPPAEGDPVAATAPKIVLAVQPTATADEIKAKGDELATFLEARMKAYGVEADIEIYVPISTAGVVEALNFGHADAAMMSAWPATLASQRAGAEVVLAEQREVIVGTTPTVGPFYYSYYVVKPDSPYQTLADLKGKTVAYPSQTSTSGYVFPVAKLVSEGLVPAPAPGKEADPKAHFGNALYAGGYPQAWAALQSGQADVAVTAGDISATLYNEILANTRIVETQGPIPSHAVVFSKDLQGPEREALRKAFLDVKGDQRDLMRKLVSGIFVEFKETTTADHTAALGDALQLTGLKFQEKI